MTDSRLAEAQERATSVAAAWGDFDPTKRQYLAGWGKAVAALSVLDISFHVQHGEDCGCDRIRARDEAITKFCNAMLGERDD